MIARNLPLTTMDRRSDDVRDANVDRWVHLIGHLLGGYGEPPQLVICYDHCIFDWSLDHVAAAAPKRASRGRVELTPSLRTDQLSGGSRIGSDRSTTVSYGSAGDVDLDRAFPADPSATPAATCRECFDRHRCSGTHSVQPRSDDRRESWSAVAQTLLHLERSQAPSYSRRGNAECRAHSATHTPEIPHVFPTTR